MGILVEAHSCIIIERKLKLVVNYVLKKESDPTEAESSLSGVNFVFALKVKVKKNNNVAPLFLRSNQTSQKRIANKIFFYNT